jgi:outer membrane protein OmpA-like peptidoglycan-associated protein
MRIFNILCSITIISLLSSCGLSNMSSKFETVSINVTPPTLQVHAGKIGVTIDASFPEKYFAKTSTIEFTPVLINEDGEHKFKAITVQGEEASGGEATIFYTTGGRFSYQDNIAYDKSMINSELELRAIGKEKEKELIFKSRKIANGVLATSTRVQNTEDLAVAKSNYEKETILEESAIIYFLVNQSNIRATEKSDDDIKRLEEFAKMGNKTHSIEVKSFASPEGSVNLNDNVSDKRAASTLNYAKKILRRVKLDGVNNKDLYSEKSEGEDWEGFNKLMRSSEIKDRRRITKIVNSVEDLEKREQAIRDMAEIYDAIEKDVLPQLRKAQITVRSFEPKKSDTEISELANTNPSELDVKELLYSASLTENIDNKISIYTQASEIHSNWKGYNNIACLLLENGNINEAEKNLLKAEKIDKNQSKISNNKAVIAAWKGNLPLAKKLYDNLTTQKNKALLDLRMANYKKASRFFKNKNTHNAALAKILNGQNSNCNENTAACDYLNAISYARSANESMLLKSLKNAISKNINYKLEAQKDLEFVNYKENEAFKSLVN